MVDPRVKQIFMQSILIALGVSILTVLVWMMFMGSFSVPDPKIDQSVVAGMNEIEARQFYMSLPMKDVNGIDAFVLGIQTLGFWRYSQAYFTLWCSTFLSVLVGSVWSQAGLKFGSRR